ncbi:DUF58 domain-containing protein [Candidatus Poribacteria bacterium]|nr:DUF58 domain-containing protein [Candidatus Poribacteria bacterium]
MNDGLAPIRFLTPRNLLVVLFCTSTSLGWSLRNPELLFIGLTALFVLVTGSWSASRYLRDVRAERRHPKRVFEGQLVHVELDAWMEGASSPSLVLAEDNFPSAAASRVRHLIAEPFAPRETVTLDYHADCVHHRGLYINGPLSFEAWDPLGLFRRQLDVPCPSEILLYPAAVDLQCTEVLGEGTLAHVGSQTTRRAGHSEEFNGLREYRPGDSPSTIHWRSTAHGGRLMVKEFQEERTTLVTFFLDLGRMGLTGLGDQTSVEYAIKAAASLAKRAVEMTHAIQLFAVCAMIEHIPPGSGTGHLLMMLDRLSFLKVSGDVDFAGTVSRHVALLPRGSTAILLQGATTIDVNTTAALISRLVDRRILPIVVLIDDRAFLKIWREQEVRHAAAMTLDESVRFLTLLGARIHVVTKARTPAEALRFGLEQCRLAHE